MLEGLADLVDVEELQAKNRLKGSTPSLQVFKERSEKQPAKELPDEDWEGLW